MPTLLRRTVLSAILSTVLVVLTLSPADAHRANVFAWAEGDRINVEASFSGGRAAMNAPIEVSDAATGAQLVTTTTDKDGVCSFAIPAAAREGRLDLRIVLLAGQGHKGEWIITADEYLGDAPDTATQSSPMVADASTATAMPSGTVDQAALEELVARAVSREVAPIRRTLAAMAEPGPSVSDVFSGIGYILGLFGIAAWMKSRKAKA